MRFFVTDPSSDAGRQLKIPGGSTSLPAVSVLGPGLDPVPWEKFDFGGIKGGDIDLAKLRAWANFNQFPPVMEVKDFNIHDLLTCNIPVVTYVHTGTHTLASAVQDFEAKAKVLRASGKYLFATADISSKDMRDFWWRKFPLIAAAY